MDRIRSSRIVPLSLVAFLGALMTGSALAQTSDMKEKERMYTYVSLWAVPRAKWTEYEKPVPADQKILDQAAGDGTLIAYGSDFNLVHSADGFTHDTWWSSHSVAGVMKVLDAFEKSSTTTSGVITSVTKHADVVLVSRHYGWHAGTYKDAYSHGSSYKLKPTAPDDAVAVLSKGIFDPIFEKLLADGSIVEYEVDEEYIHTEAPDSFWIYYVTPNAEGIDKVNAAVREGVKANSLIGPALDSMVDFTPHRDFLDRTQATFK
jgi:ABC-type transport system substrate-binding protein